LNARAVRVDRRAGQESNSTPRERDGERRFERRTETKPTCQLGRNRTPKSRLKIHKDVSETIGVGPHFTSHA
jgi:hypothetical protein